MKKKLVRLKKDRFFLGVLGGAAAYFSIDPVFIRILFLAALLFTGVLPLFIAYLIAAFIMPLEPKNSSLRCARTLFRSKKNRCFAGICGGVGEALHFDPTVVRLIAVFLCLITGFLPFFVTYILGWLLIPEKPVKK